MTTCFTSTMPSWNRMILPLLAGAFLVAASSAAGQSKKQEFLAIAKTHPAIAFHGEVTYGVGEGKPLMLDLAIPSNAKTACPVVIVLHGTGLSKGRVGVRKHALALAEAGFAAVAVGFRHECKHPFPAALDDVNASLDWIDANAKKYKLDKNRIGILGFSGGGSLATMASAKKPARVRAVVSYFAPSDLATLHRNSTGISVYFVRPMLERWLGGGPDKAPRSYQQASPISYVHREMPPHLLIHGTADEIVPVEQSRLLARRMKQVGAKVNLLTFEDAPHNFDEETGMNAGLAFWNTEGFLSEHLMHGRIALSRTAAATRKPHASR